MEKSSKYCDNLNSYLNTYLNVIIHVLNKCTHWTITISYQNGPNSRMKKVNVYKFGNVCELWIFQQKWNYLGSIPRLITIKLYKYTSFQNNSFTFYALKNYKECI